MRPELIAPNAEITFEGLEHIPAEGPAIVVFNHRSYFDPTVMGLLLTLAHCITSDVEIYRFDINEDWRCGVRVMRRLRVN
jgi:1-acyl-sn-glycerol-3-phosphate acyltransferase